MVNQNDSNLGVKVRDFFMAVGYWRKWLVAENESGDLYISEEEEQCRDVGTICDSDTLLVPVSFLPPEDFAAFRREFAMEA